MLRPKWGALTTQSQPGPHTGYTSTGGLTVTAIYFLKDDKEIGRVSRPLGLIFQPVSTGHHERTVRASCVVETVNDTGSTKVVCKLEAAHSPLA